MSGFTTVDLGCERGNNAYNIVQCMDEPQATQICICAPLTNSGAIP